MNAPESAETVAIAEKIREAMIDCLEERFGRYYATETGCEKLRGILDIHGIKAAVSIGEDGRFKIAVPVNDQPQRHTCHWPGCKAAVPPAMWGCKPHWFALPKQLRDRIWETYRPGQEISKTPSAEYVKVAQEVQQWIAGYRGDA